MKKTTFSYVRILALISALIGFVTGINKVQFGMTALSLIFSGDFNSLFLRLFLDGWILLLGSLGYLLGAFILEEQNRESYKIILLSLSILLFWQVISSFWQSFSLTSTLDHGIFVVLRATAVNVKIGFLVDFFVFVYLICNFLNLGKIDGRKDGKA